MLLAASTSLLAAFIAPEPLLLRGCSVAVRYKYVGLWLWNYAGGMGLVAWAANQRRWLQTWGERHDCLGISL